MGTYKGLPTELQVQIASYLSSRDLAALARVNRSQVTIVREHLYHAPEILKPDEGHHLMALLRTLFARPQLIDKIRSLTLSVVDCTMPFNPGSLGANSEESFSHWDKSDNSLWCPEYQSIQEKLLHRLSERSTTSQENLNWMQNVHRWGTSSFYSGLLVLLPNLERVSISCYFKPVGGQYRVASPRFHRRVFGRSPYDYLDSTSQQQMQLKELRVEAGLLNRSMLEIPRIHRLSLGSQAEVASALGANELRHITHFEATFSFAAVNSLGWPFLYARALIHSMFMLKKVKLQVESPSDKRPDDSRDSLIKQLFTILGSLDLSMSTLETLVVVPAERRRIDNFKNLDPLPDLRRFNCLRKLTLPFRLSVDTLKYKLSPSIEELDLHLSSTGPANSSVLEDIAHHKLEFGKLRRLDLFIWNEGDIVWSESRWGNLKKSGVATYIWIREHTLLYAMPV